MLSISYKRVSTWLAGKTKFTEHYTQAKKLRNSKKWEM